MEKEPLLHEVGRVRDRLTLFGLTRMSLAGLFAGSVAGALVLAASRIWPLLHSRLLFVSLLAAGLIAGLGLGLWRRAGLKEAARRMDRGEPQDAIMTALDGMLSETETTRPDTNPVIVRLQREEATETARRYTSDLRRSLPWPSWKRWSALVYGALAVWIMIGVLLLVPNPLDERAAALSESKEALEQLEKEREAIEDKLAELTLPEAEKEKLLTPLDELRKSMDAPGVDPAKALKELEAAMKELEFAAKEAQAAAQRLEAAADAMTQQRELKKLGEALQARAAEALSGAIDELRSRLKELSPAEREALAQALERLAEQQPQEGAAGELAAALEKAAQQARAAGDAAAEGAGAAGAGEGGGDGLAALEEALARGLTQGELEALARAAAGQLGRSGQQLAETLAEQGAAVPPSWAAGAGGGAAGQGSGSEGNGAGQGSGGGAGQGSGSGAGQGSGSGAGQGSGSGAGQGSGAGTGTGGRQLITTPRSMKGTGPVENDNGPSTGGQTQTGGQSPMIDGTTRPYDEVYSEYAAEAKKSLGRSQLPASLQGKVKRYFDEIQPN